MIRDRLLGLYPKGSGHHSIAHVTRRKRPVMFHPAIDRKLDDLESRGGKTRSAIIGLGVEVLHVLYLDGDCRDVARKMVEVARDPADLTAGLLALMLEVEDASKGT